MKSLDGETPSGYFEALPTQTLGRLEASMQSQGPTVTSSDASGSTGVPPNQPAAAREEDSGLHDIRSLATSQRMRNSSRRISTSPPVDEELLAASSGGWKAVALPVAEPVRDEAPLDKKRASRSSKQMAAFVPAPQTAETTEPISLAARAAKKQKSKAPLFAVASLGLAAAAGAAIYVSTKDRAPAEQATTIAASANGSTEPVAKVTPLPGATATPIEQAPAAPTSAEAAAAQAPLADNVVAAAEPATDEKAAGQKDRDEESSTKRAKGKRGRDERAVVAAKTESKKPDATKTSKTALPTGSGAAVVKPTTKSADKNEEPSFEELLKEANIPDNKKVDDKPKLEKKSLSGADIKKGMSAVAGKAQGCYNGTQGTASVKLVVDPSGKVSKVSVTGAFAGTPVAACVEKAVKAATFPPWDGGPQSFGYSYLLSE